MSFLAWRKHGSHAPGGKLAANGGGTFFAQLPIASRVLCQSNSHLDCGPADDKANEHKQGA